MWQLCMARPSTDTLGLPALGGRCSSPCIPLVGIPMPYLVFKKGLHSDLEAVGNPFSTLPDIEDQQAAVGGHAGGHDHLERGRAPSKLGLHPENLGCRGKMFSDFPFWAGGRRSWA